MVAVFQYCFLCFTTYHRYHNLKRRPLFVSTSIIELDGTSAGTVAGFKIQAASTVRGIVINRFSSTGITLQGTSEVGYGRHWYVACLTTGD